MQNNTVTSDTCQQVRNFAVSVSSSNRRLTGNSRHKAKWHFASLVLLLAMMLGFIQQGFTQTVTNPTSPWTVPAGVASIKVEVWGGGGAGGGCNSTLGASYGSGGGGGAYNVSTFSVSTGQTYSITIGAGGTGSSDANGTNGTGSTVSGPGGSVTANPGLGGARRGGTAGTGGTSGFNNGGNGGTATSNGAGGGGGAGNATPSGGGNGGNGSNTAAGTAGAGALPGGAGGANQTGNGDGNAGNAPGGGGGGGHQGGLWNGSKNGGAGAAGKVVITYTVVPAPTITDFSPTYACSGSLPSVTITGTNFTGASAVTFNGSAASSFIVDNATQIRATIPAGATTGPIAVTTIGGTGTSSTNFTVSSPVASVTSQTNITCNAADNGTITVSAGGGIPPYQFSLDNGEPYTAGSNPYTFTGLKPNVPYMIRVKDSHDCTSPIIP